MAAVKIRRVSKTSDSHKYEKGAYVSFWFRMGTYVYMRWLECEMESDPLCSLDNYVSRYVYDDEGTYQGVVCVNTINYLIQKLNEIESKTHDNDLPTRCRNLSIILKRIVAQICIDPNLIILPKGRSGEFVRSIRWMTKYGLKLNYFDTSFQPYISKPNQDCNDVQGDSNEVSTIPDLPSDRTKGGSYV